MAAAEKYFSLGELLAAYRKAKAEAFYDTNCAHGLKFSAYEKKLIGNLRKLLDKLNTPESNWHNDAQFIGDATCIPKSISPPTRKSGSSRKVHFQSSDQLEQWCQIARTGKKAEAEFRTVIDATVDYLVISALWVIKVGHIYDEVIDTLTSMGSRLRRWRPAEHQAAGTSGELNLESANLFAPYFIAYGNWRARGIEVMKSELKKGHRIVAITMDLKQFYHRVNPSFLLDPDYLAGIVTPLSKEDHKFTSQLISSFDTWNKVAFENLGETKNGIPVGLSASAVIANCLLRDFDMQVKENLKPAYYGRYVDDVILVQKVDEAFKTGEDFLEFFANRMSPTLSFEPLINGDRGLLVHLPYHKSKPEQELLFAADKQKIFQLKGAEGLDLINPIEEQIKAQSSEFRDLPDLPTTEGEMASRALLVTPDAQLLADALRKADAVTLRRSGFALLLSDVEAHARDVESNSWKPIRDAFLDLIERHLLMPEPFFALSRYLPRILGVTLQCRDYERGILLLDKIGSFLDALRDGCSGEFESFPSKELEFRKNFGKRMMEVIFQQPPDRASNLRPILESIGSIFNLAATASYRPASIRRKSTDLLFADWSRISYSAHWLSRSNACDLKNPSRPTRLDLKLGERFSAIDLFTEAGNLPTPYWPPLVFPTRPISVTAITAQSASLLLRSDDFTTVVRGLRGNWVPENLSLVDLSENDKSDEVLELYISSSQSNPPTLPHLALTSFEVTEDQWKKAATGAPDLSLERYKKLHQVLNLASKADPKPTYILLPELAIPRSWIQSILRKMGGRNISLIGGLEYRVDINDPKLLYNEAVISLRSNFLGYDTNFVILQPKQAPAWEEARLLAELKPPLSCPTTKYGFHPVYIHGDFAFGVLICSELTDMANRLRFQGKVDALMVPEWNKDLNSFSSLVEASALDVHAFIAQANNRKYGDTRLRGPMKDIFMRDIVRVKGGENDYFVVAIIKYWALRKFQRHPIPPVGDDEMFKPFPKGFPERLSKFRKVSGFSI
jgi:hypothetical protein